ncbi:MAG: hypothetical protein HQL33_03745, partial [Alphaproteobacteria bacterium]|nr:hypothetical protein [Alphaproteobacteria bacterium]
LPLPPLFTPPPLPPATSPAPGQDEPAPEPRKLEIDDQDVVKREEILRMEAMKMEKLTRMRRLAAKLRKKAPPPP